MLLGLSLAVAALGFLTSPAVAASAPVLSVSDQAFLASLAKAPGGTPAPELAARRPSIGYKSMCTANCANGGTVSCSGSTCSAVNGSCPSEPGHVTCDGVTTSCSACTGCGEIGVDWCTGEDACAANCSPCDYTYTCNATFCTDHCRCNFRTCLQ